MAHTTCTQDAQKATGLSIYGKTKIQIHKYTVNKIKTRLNDIRVALSESN